MKELGHRTGSLEKKPKKIRGNIFWGLNYYVKIFRTRNGRKASGVRREMFFVLMCVMLVGPAVTAADLVIDDFSYATSAAAQSEWMPIGSNPASKPVIMTTEGVYCMSGILDFTNATTKGSWDRTVALDISPCTVIEVRAKCTRQNLCLIMMFETSGGGWYGRTYYLTDQWVTYKCPMNIFMRDATCSGWNNITRIRLAFYQENNPAAATVYFDDLRATEVDNINILVNSGFEITTAENMPDFWWPSSSGFGCYVDHWVLDTDCWRSKWGVDRTVSHSGQNSLRIVNDTAYPTDNMASFCYNYTRMLPNSNSIFSVWLRSDVANMPVQYWLGGFSPGTGKGGIFTTHSTPNTWQRYYVNVSATDSTGWLYGFIQPTGNCTLWVDDVQWEYGTTLTDWKAGVQDAEIFPTMHKTVSAIGDLSIVPGNDSVSVSIDANRRFLVDGQPFIPIASSWGTVPSADVIEHFAKAGYNTIIPILSSSTSALSINTFLNDAKNNGTKVIMMMDTSISDTGLATFINTYKCHPSIIAWYVYDEPHDSATWTSANTRYAIAQTKDPSVPALVNLNSCGLQFANDWNSDILLMDSYPIGWGNNVDYIAGAYELLNQTAVTAGKPCWTWMQSCGYAYNFYREPTGAEAECMAYRALIHGSRGLLMQTQKPRLSEQWNELRHLTDEVYTLTPALYSTATAPTVTANSSHIHVLSANCDGLNYIITVNDSPLSVNATLTSSTPNTKSAIVLFEDRTVSVVNGTISDTFAGYARHVYSYPESPLNLKFDEGNGTSVAAAVPYASITGTAPSTSWVSGVDGQSGHALSFNGSASYVNIPSNNLLAVTDDGVTFSAWVKPGTLSSSYNMALSHGSGHYLSLYNGCVMFKILTDGGSQRWCYSSATLAVNTWYHIAGSYDREGKMKVFINGRQNGSTAGPFLNPDSNTNSLTIGKYNGYSLYYFNGIIDDVQICRKGCTDKEIRKLKDSAIIAYSLPLNEGTGTTAYDNFDSSRQAIVTGATWQLDKRDNVLCFDGVNDYAEISNSSSVNITGTEGFTFSAWIKGSNFATNNYNMIISKGVPYLGIYNGKAVVSVRKSDATQVWLFGNTTLQTGNWYHIAGVFGADRGLKLYVNGIQDASTSVANSLMADSGNLFIGRYASPALYFNGIISNARIYKRGLTADEISLLYQNKE